MYSNLDIRIEDPPIFSSYPERYKYVKRLDSKVFWPIEQNPRYVINKSGEIFDTDLNRPAKRRIKNDRALVFIYNSTNTKIRTLNVAKLLLNTFLPIPGGSESEFEVIFVDGNRHNCTFDNCKRAYMFIKWIYKDDPTIKRVPGFPGYIMTPEGKFFGIKSGEEVHTGIDSNSYINIRLCDEDGAYHMPSVHRLLALAYIPTEGRSPSILVVNHKNCNKTDNSINLNDIHGPSTNLEWVTRTENIYHAMRNRLYVDARETTIIDIITGNKTCYSTIAAAARSINISHIKACSIMNKLNLINDRYLIETTKDIITEIPNSGQIKITNIKIKASKVYRDIKEVSRIFGLYESIINRYIETDLLYKSKYKIENV